SSTTASVPAARSASSAARIRVAASPRPRWAGAVATRPIRARCGSVVVSTRRYAATGASPSSGVPGTHQCRVVGSVSRPSSSGWAHSCATTNTSTRSRQIAYAVRGSRASKAAERTSGVGGAWFTPRSVSHPALLRCPMGERAPARVVSRRAFGPAHHRADGRAQAGGGSFGTASGGPLDEEGREYGFTDRFRAGAELTDGTLLFQFR